MFLEEYNNRSIIIQLYGARICVTEQQKSGKTVFCVQFSREKCVQPVPSIRSMQSRSSLRGLFTLVETGQRSITCSSATSRSRKASRFDETSQPTHSSSFKNNRHPVMHRPHLAVCASRDDRAEEQRQRWRARAAAIHPTDWPDPPGGYLSDGCTTAPCDAP